MNDLAVHPVADLFPMLADDELAELAEDIKQRGLIQPIVLDTQGRVLDGRNRLAACRLAGVEPAFETYDGDDPDGYALAVNVARRHLRPSQRYVLIEQARRLTKTPKSGFSGTLDPNRLSEAAVVLDYAPDLADAVVANAMSLDTAANTARQRKRDAAQVKAKKDRLRKHAPDLAEHVDDGRLDLDEALGALDAREEKARQEVEQERQAELARASEAERLRRIQEQEHEESLERHRERIRRVTSGWPTLREVFLPDPGSPLAKEVLDGLGSPDREALNRILIEIEGWQPNA